jgi:enoyl-CoA hydratase/carnithine racemase
MSADDEVLLERDDRVARLTINRPRRRNALSSSVITGLRRALAEVRRAPELRVVVLTGAGDKAFCAGADLVGPSSPAAPAPVAPVAHVAPVASDVDVAPDTLGEDDNPAGREHTPGAAELHDARGELARLMEDLWDLGKPSIARVRGYALAGGMGLALSCDLVVAGDDAVFGTPEIDIGIWPYMITVPLLRAMPAKRALELMLTGRRVGAAEAERIGFVNRVVPVAELDTAVDELAQALAHKPPNAMRMGRESFYTAADLGAREALRYLHPLLSLATATAEAAEGRAAFAAKRPPRWAE